MTDINLKSIRSESCRRFALLMLYVMSAILLGVQGSLLSCSIKLTSAMLLARFFVPRHSS